MKKIKNLSYIIITICLLFAVGCAGKQTDVKSIQPMPSAWSMAQDNNSSKINTEWWKSFNSPVLEKLIEESLKKNPDLMTATENIIQSEAQLTSTSSSIFPSIDLSGKSGATKSYPNSGTSHTSKSTNASLGVSYEVDLWGRVSANIRSAKESLKSTEFDYETARLTLTSGVTTAYFKVLAVDKQIEYAQTNLQTAESILKIVDAKYRNGSALKSDLLNQQSTVLGRKSTLLALVEQKKQYTNALAILIGVTPQEFSFDNESFDTLNIPEVSAGLPSDLLLRRPDLASAEADIRAADANADAARAALFPTLSLSGSAGISSASLLALTNPASNIGLTGSLVQTIFDGGKKRSQIKISESQQRALIVRYRKAVLTSLQEVEDALNSAYYSKQKEEIQAETTEKLQTSLRLTEYRYKEGADSLTDVLNGQTSLFSARDQLVSMRLSRLNAAVDLYKVLGGGWELPKKYSEK